MQKRDIARLPDRTISLVFYVKADKKLLNFQRGEVPFDACCTGGEENIKDQ